MAYFVIFEIPTFLLFSILVFSIYTFKRVAYRKAFFPQEQAKFILILGLPLVWSLWLIVTLVYSEVIVGLFFVCFFSFFIFFFFLLLLSHLFKQNTLFLKIYPISLSFISFSFFNKNIFLKK